MKIEVKRVEEVEIEKVRIQIPIRRVGDEEDDGEVPEDFPFMSDGFWRVDILIDTGQIVGWPIWREFDLFEKVCDGGTYELIDYGGNTVIGVSGCYVPSAVPNEYSDYVDLKIDSTGLIKNWNCNPAVDDFFYDDND